MKISTLLTALLCTAAFTITANAADEAALLKIIGDTNATDVARITAAHELAGVGTHTSMATLTALLYNEKPELRDAARFAMETNSCPTVEATLLEAAQKLTGNARIGAIQSLGKRGTEKSVPFLAELLSSNDTALKNAAAQALGKIASPEVLTHLRPYIERSPAAALAYLNAAEKISEENPGKGTDPFRILAAANIAEPIKNAALRNAILLYGKDGYVFWEKSIASTSSPSAINAALRVVTDYPDDKNATAIFAAALKSLPENPLSAIHETAYPSISEDTRIRLIENLATRGDTSAIGAILPFTDADTVRRVAARDALTYKANTITILPPANDAVRLAAARAIAALGNDTDAEKTFNELLASKDENIAIAAQNALRGLSWNTPAEEAKLGFKPMFDGETLNGWRGGDGWWNVVNNIMTAESTPEKVVKQNSHLFYEGGKGGDTGDFEMRAEFRLSKDANSGIQFRASDKNADSSYQADMNGTGEYIGFIYHPAMHLVGERGAKVVLDKDGKKTITPFANKEVLAKYAVKNNTWNEYRIVAKGHVFTLYLNGIKTCELVDERPGIPLKGFITLQMHVGPPMKIEYRNLRIRDL